MKTIEEIVEAIQEQAQEAFIRQCSGGTNWHSLILTGAGEIYWTENVDQHSCSEAVWKGEDYCVMKFQGWCPDEDQAYYEQIEASEEVVKKIKENIKDWGEDQSEVEIDGESYHRGEKHNGFDPLKWYKNGDLYVDEPEMWPSMGDAIEAIEEFWAEVEG